MEFRKDINGLRAIAVLAVVFYHFGVPGFKGGFSGVDIFFVISGYLMTGIIFSKIAKGNFSLLGFYLARAQRIIPALLAMCIALFLALWFFLPPSEYIKFSSESIGAVSFLSNIQFWQESGYFDSDAHEKWLLHTWSLSVEWQFYILYPAFILICKNIFQNKTIKPILIVCALISFCLSACVPMRWVDAGFYLLPTRAWEMIAGGLVFLFPATLSRRNSLFLELIGIFLLLISIFYLDSQLKWPGYFAIIPVLGTALIIIAANNTSLITTNRAAQFLGKVSYSYYLWHWPVCVALYYFQESSATWATLGILSSLLLAVISFQLVEQKTRTLGKGKSVGKMLSYYIASASLVAIIGGAVVYLKGIPSRLDPIIVAADFERKNRNPRHQECSGKVTQNPKLPKCIFGKEQDKIALIVIGDSHSNSVISAVADAVPDKKGGVLHFGADGCATVKGLTNSFVPFCNLYNEKVLNTILAEYPTIPVLIVNRTTAPLAGPNESQSNVVSEINGIKSTSDEYIAAFSSGLKSTICSLSDNRDVFILKPIPEMKTDVPMKIIKKLTFGNDREDIFITRDAYNKRHKKTNEIIDAAATSCGAKVLDPVPYLCDDSKCNGSIQGRPLYFDDDHMSEFGNKFLIPLFGKIWM